MRFSLHTINRMSCVLFVLAFAVAGCQTTPNPVTGRPEVVLMSPEDEREVGAKGAEQVETQFGLVQNPTLQAYVGELGDRLARHSPRQSMVYRVRAIEMDGPNAFALPGGQIYVSRGLILLTNSKAELANVIAHEIGHVAARHAAQRHAHVNTLGVATLLGTIAAGGGRNEDESIGGIAGAAAYGRNQEREADRVGMDIAVSAKVDPGGLADFLRTLEKWERLQRGYAQSPSYFASHPATSERVAEAASSAETRRHALPAFHPEDTTAHLDTIRGMAVGRPASEGAFEGDRFLHADLGISLRFPKGWERMNQNTQVVAVSPRGDALVILQLVGEAEDAEAAAHQNAENEDFQLQGGSSIRVGGLEAYRARATITTSFGPVDAEATWVVMDGRVFRLLGGVEKGSLDRYEATFRNFARSFRPLHPQERRQISDLRLEIVRSRKGETLRDVAARTGNEWDLNATAVANGVDPTAPLAEERPVKIVVRRKLFGTSEGLDPTPRTNRE